MDILHSIQVHTGRYAPKGGCTKQDSVTLACDDLMYISHRGKRAWAVGNLQYLLAVAFALSVEQPCCLHEH